MMYFLLQIVYRFIQLTARVGNILYFRELKFINKAPLKASGPLIVVVNHPNTLLDVLVTAVYTRVTCFFLANYSLFKNPILGTLLHLFYCIPIKRPQDIGGIRPDNDDAFKQCDEHLSKGGSIFIAAEGESWMWRHIHNLKTGTARIAFSAEMQNNWSLGLRILPFGITYERPHKMWYRVSVSVGNPIVVSDWREKYLENPRNAVSDLTDTIEKMLVNQTVSCKDEAEDVFLEKIETILRNDVPLESFAHEVENRSVPVLHQLRDFEANMPQDCAHFKHQVNTYFDTLTMLNLEDIAQEDIDKKGISNIFGDVLRAVLEAPVLLIGIVTNGLPAFLCRQLAKKMKLYIGYESTVKYVSGLIFFPLWWWIATKLLDFGVQKQNIALPHWWWIVWVLMLPIWAFWAKDISKQWLYARNIRRFKAKNEAYHLAEKRHKIVSELERIQTRTIPDDVRQRWLR